MKAMQAVWTARVLTIHPEMFPGPLGLALAGRALADGLWALVAVDIRNFAGGRHRTVDDAPFGGGHGMVMKPDVVSAAIEHTVAQAQGAAGAPPVVYLTPRGRPLDQARVRRLSAGTGVVIVCGRYEGVDERVIEAHAIEEISIGDFVLSGGEPAAVALIDAAVRLLPGVVNHPQGLADESFEIGLLEYPQYTRPRVWNEREVPEVLLSGHHNKVRAWRRDQAEKTTRERRPDMWARYAGAQN